MSSGEWNVPAGGSYMARMLSDAGGRYPWSMTEGAGSLKLDAAAVLDKAEMADFWLIRSFGPMTLAGLKESNPLNGHFKAVGDGGVYVCDTSVSPCSMSFLSIRNDCCATMQSFSIRLCSRVSVLDISIS